MAMPLRYRSLIELCVCHEPSQRPDMSRVDKVLKGLSSEHPGSGPSTQQGPVSTPATSQDSAAATSGPDPRGQASDQGPATSETTGTAASEAKPEEDESNA